MFFIHKCKGAHESFINITEPSGKYKSEVPSTRKEVKWFVKYSGHPFPTLVWHDTRGNEIPWSVEDDKNRKFVATKDKASTTLKIKNPRISDSGFYTLFASNDKMHREQQFQLLVKGIIFTQYDLRNSTCETHFLCKHLLFQFLSEKPQLNMENVSIKPGEKAVLNCEIYGYPTSKVTWSFIPCQRLEFNTHACNNSLRIALNVSACEFYT